MNHDTAPGLTAPCSATLAPRAPRLPECPTHREPLAEQRAPIHALDRRVRLRLGLVLDEGVAFDEARAPVQIQVHILDLPELRKSLENVVLLRLLVHAGDNDDPTLDGAGWAASIILVEGLEQAGFANVAVILFTTTAFDAAPAHPLLRNLIVVVVEGLE